MLSTIFIGERRRIEKRSQGGDTRSKQSGGSSKANLVFLVGLAIHQLRGELRREAKLATRSMWRQLRKS